MVLVVVVRCSSYLFHKDGFVFLVVCSVGWHSHSLFVALVGALTRCLWRWLAHTRCESRCCGGEAVRVEHKKIRKTWLREHFLADYQRKRAPKGGCTQQKSSPPRQL